MDIDTSANQLTKTTLYSRLYSPCRAESRGIGGKGRFAPRFSRGSLDLDREGGGGRSGRVPSPMSIHVAQFECFGGARGERKEGQTTIRREIIPQLGRIHERSEVRCYFYII